MASRAVPDMPSVSKSPKMPITSPVSTALLSLSTAFPMSGSSIGSWESRELPARNESALSRRLIPRLKRRRAWNGGRPSVLAISGGGASRCLHSREGSGRLEGELGVAVAPCALPLALCTVFESAEHQAGVVAAEPKRVAHRGPRCDLTRAVGRVVQIAFGIGNLEVDGRRYLPTVDGHY